MNNILRNDKVMRGKGSLFRRKQEERILKNGMKRIREQEHKNFKKWIEKNSDIKKKVKMLKTKNRKDWR